MVIVAITPEKVMLVQGTKCAAREHRKPVMALMVMVLATFSSLRKSSTARKLGRGARNEPEPVMMTSLYIAVVMRQKF